MGTLAQNTSKAVASLHEKSHDQDAAGPLHSCLFRGIVIYAPFEVKNGIIAYFKRIFTVKRSPRIFGSLFFLAEIFEKLSFDPYNFRITRLSAKKSEQMKNF